MWQRGRLKIAPTFKVLTMLGLALCFVASADDAPATHGDQTAAPTHTDRPTQTDNKPVDIETLRKWVNGEEAEHRQLVPGDDKWWSAAEELLNRWAMDSSHGDKDLGKKKAEDFLGTLGNKAKEFFKPLLKARFVDDPQDLRKWAYDDKNPNLRDAAKVEIRRRLKDPTLKLVAKLFGMRPERAMLYVDKLLKAKSDKIAGKVYASLFGTVNTAQRKHIREVTEMTKNEAEKKGLDWDVVKRLREAAADSLDDDTLADDASAFQKAFHDPYRDVVKNNQKFYDLVRRAAGTGSDAEKAKKELLANYDPEEVLDFIRAQRANGNDGVAVKVTEAIANRDKDGNLTLKLSAHNVDYDGKSPNQILWLGKAGDDSNVDPEQVNAALNAFDRGGDATKKETEDQPGNDGRLQLFELGLTGDSTPTRFVAEASPKKDGAPVLTVSDTPTPDDTVKLAAQKILHPWKPKNVDAAPKHHAEESTEKKTKADGHDSADPDDDSKGGAVMPPAADDTKTDDSTKSDDTTKKDDGGTDDQSTGAPKALALEKARATATRACAKCHGAGGSNVDDFAFDPKTIEDDASDILDAIKSGGMPKGNRGFRKSPEGQALIQWLQSKVGNE